MVPPLFRKFLSSTYIVSSGCFVPAEYERGGTWRDNQRGDTACQETRIIPKTQGGVSEARGDVHELFMRSEQIKLLSFRVRP